MILNIICKISSNSIAGDNGVISALFSGYDKVTRPDFGEYGHVAFE